MTKRRKFEATLLLVGILVAGIGVFAILNLRRATQETWQMHTEMASALDLITELEYQTQETRRSMLYSFTTTDPNLQVNYSEGSRAADKRVTQLIAGYLKLTSSSKESIAGQRLWQDWQEYAKTRDEMVAMILEGSVKEAVQLDSRAGIPSFNRVRDDVNEVEQIYKSQSGQRFTEVKRAFSWAIFRLGIILCLTILFAGVAVRQLEKGQMLRAVQRSEARLREVIESINEGMCVVGRDGRVDLWNRAAEEGLRRQRQEVLGHPLFEFFSDFQDSRLSGAIAEARDSGSSIVLEDLQLIVDGTQHIFFARIFPFEGGATIFLNDVGERKQAEKRLAAQHGTTKALAESGTLAEAVPKILEALCGSLGWDLGFFWGVDPSMDRLTLVHEWHSNRIPEKILAEATRVSQFSRGEGLPGCVWGKGALDWVSNILKRPDFLQGRFTTRAGLHGAVAFPVQNSKQMMGVIEILTRDIPPANEDFLNVLEVIEGQVCQFAERERAKMVQAATFRAAGAANSAASLEELYRSIHSIVNDLMPAKNFSVGLYSSENEILSFPYFVDEHDPPPAPRKLKKGLMEYVRRTGSALLAPRAVVEELKEKGEVEDIETPGVCWLGVPLKRGEETVGILAVKSYTEGVTFGDEELQILTFVAAQMSMAIERHRSEAELKSALQMKSDFVSFATHQLRTPLAGIKWSLELAAQEENLSEEAASFIQDGRDSAQRLIGMVNDLLDVSRLESGKLKLVPKETSLADLTRSVLKDVSHHIEKQGHHLSVEGIEETPPVMVDPQLFRQVILNMVSNAIKYTPSGGKIDIRMSRENRLVRWAITDSGIGIPKANQARLFEKFYRAENVYKIETEGTGLGLHLVKMIVERSGGRIWCESEENKGSTFQFTLPLSGGNG